MSTFWYEHCFWYGKMVLNIERKVLGHHYRKSVQNKVVPLRVNCDDSSQFTPRGDYKPILFSFRTEIKFRIHILQ